MTNKEYFKLQNIINSVYRKKSKNSFIWERITIDIMKDYDYDFG